MMKCEGSINGVNVDQHQACSLSSLGNLLAAFNNFHIP